MTELGEVQNLNQLVQLMRQHGAETIVYKRLAPNDNSKNQIYLGAGYDALQLIPMGEVLADKSRKDSMRDRFKAKLNFYWVSPSGNLFHAPSAQLIFYPKYPEVRFSGFLKGAQQRPGNLLTSRIEGRVLILGFTSDRRVIGHVIDVRNQLAGELRKYDQSQPDTTLKFVYGPENAGGDRDRLLADLKEISEMGWVDSFRLSSNGDKLPYEASNGGGYTLEGLLGIIPNGLNEPDYLGWELKQHSTGKLDQPLSGQALTLMTPEPTAGFYKLRGVVEFVKTFGYPDKKGIRDRFNFGGIHKVDVRTELTGLTLMLQGYDKNKCMITDVEAGVALVADDGEVAAIWDYSSLLEKWNRKHQKAVYIASKKRICDHIQYTYGHVVALAEGTSFQKFLNGMAKKIVYYDPGIKVENIYSEKPKSKKRNQFRVHSGDVPILYERIELVDLRGI